MTVIKLLRKGIEPFEEREIYSYDSEKNVSAFKKSHDQERMKDIGIYIIENGHSRSGIPPQLPKIVKLGEPGFHHAFFEMAKKNYCEDNFEWRVFSNPLKLDIPEDSTPPLPN